MLFWKSITSHFSERKKMKHLTQLLTILVGIVLISSTGSAQLTVVGGDLNVPDNHVKIGPASAPNLKIYNDGEMAWNSPGQADWTLRPNGANMFRIGTSGSPSGANTFVINSVGQVGFGGTPGTQFDVKGPMKLYGSLGGAEMMFDPQTAAAWTIRGGEGGLFRIGSTDSGANHLVLNNDGNVGIGTTTPVARLDVATGGIHASGTIDSDALLQVGDTKLYDGELQYRLAGQPQWTVRASGANLYRIGNDDVSANMFVINSGGQVGIGTAAPEVTLHSAGTIRSDTGLQLADDYEIDWVGTGTKIGGRPHVMNFNVGNALPLQIYNDGRVIVGAGDGTAATAANPIRLQVHGRSMVGALGVGIDDGEPISALIHSAGTIRSDAGLQLANDHELDWVATGSRIGARADRMTVEVGGNLNAILEKGGRLLVGSNNHAATNPNDILLQVHGRGMLGALGVGVEDGEPLDAKLHVEGQVKITGGEPGEGKVLTSDGDGLASWQAASDGSQGPAGPAGAAGAAGAQGAQGKQGPPGQSASSDCVECAVLQQVTFDAVCKIFDGAITNTAEVGECIGVIGQLALIGVDICSPNETDCLSVIQGNVQDLLDSK